MAMLRTVAHEVGNAERGCHMNQLRHERASQELAQPRRWWCLLRTIFRGHEISAHVGQWAKGFSRSVTSSHSDGVTLQFPVAWRSSRNDMFEVVGQSEQAELFAPMRFNQCVHTLGRIAARHLPA